MLHIAALTMTICLTVSSLLRQWKMSKCEISLRLKLHVFSVTTYPSDLLLILRSEPMRVTQNDKSGSMSPPTDQFLLSETTVYSPSPNSRVRPLFDQREHVKGSIPSPLAHNHKHESITDDKEIFIHRTGCLKRHGIWYKQTISDDGD